MKKKRIAFCLILFILLSISIYMYCRELGKTNFSTVMLNETDLVEKDNKEELLQNEKNKISAIKEEYQNNDVKALLRIPGKKEWIIPQGKDNNYYLRHLLTGTYDRNGTPFLDSRINIDNSKKLLIYGHNSSKYEMPFKEVENYINKDYLKSHPILELETENKVRRFQVFSVYVETKDFSYYNKISFTSNDEYFRHIKALKDKSLIDTGVSINKNDKILILQTCSTLKKYQSAKKKFMLVIAKEVS